MWFFSAPEKESQDADKWHLADTWTTRGLSCARKSIRTVTTSWRDERADFSRHRRARNVVATSDSSAKTHGFAKLDVLYRLEVVLESCN